MMNQEMLAIYGNLRDGKITSQEALDRIRSLKAGTRKPGSRLLFACPEWVPEDLAADDATHFEEREVVSLSLTGENPAGQYLGACETVFASVKHLLGLGSSKKRLAQIVVPAGPHEELFLGLNGLLKTAAMEDPGFTGQILVVSRPIQDTDLAVLLEREASAASGSVVRHIQGKREVLAYREIPSPPSGQAGNPFRENGAYIISGGTGGLGAKVAQHILASAEKSIVHLLGRSDVRIESHPVFGARHASGRVHYHKVDVASLPDVQECVKRILEGGRPVSGIIHCAGIRKDEFMVRKQTDRLREVLSPKVNGCVNLDLATADLELDFMACFSSVASVTGNIGQADYAAANGFLDAFAKYRNSLVTAGTRRGITVSINWSLWDEGMAVTAADQDRLKTDYGMLPIPSTMGLEAFQALLGFGREQVLVALGDSGRMKEAFFGRTAPKGPAALRPMAGDEAAGRIDPELSRETQAYLSTEFSSILNIPRHEIDIHAALEKYGINSILALQFINKLEKGLGGLPKTLLFEYQSIAALSTYFVREHGRALRKHLGLSQGTAEESRRMDASPASPGARPASRRPRRPLSSRRSFQAADGSAAHKIAIVGLSGKYPESPDLERFWQNLLQGKDCIIEVPKERWDWRQHYTRDRAEPGKHFSKWGGFISGVEEFDPRFFGISPREAENIDPQERLFLQYAWMALEDAGYTRERLAEKGEGKIEGKVGVYAGAMYSEYQLFGAQGVLAGTGRAVPGSYASIANRVSYFLDIHGPSLTLDTMCSSSLSAIHLAAQDLKAGRTHLALAGGVNVSIHPGKYQILSSGQFISSDGHCQSFGIGGDGYIPGEGVGVVVLKRLADAERDRDHIYGIVAGSALNHGGKTNGYSVPNPVAQTEVILGAFQDAGMSPDEIGYIEAHGTGTRLGDPIEVAALAKAFKDRKEEAGTCLIGSVKSNIGHCESAAGIAGLTKVLLQIKHRKLVPSLHSETLNPHIDFGKTPFEVIQSVRAWMPVLQHERPQPLAAGISSFGAGGSNAHLIIQEYPAPQGNGKIGGQGGEWAFPLSARTREQLKQKAVDLLGYLETASHPDPDSIAYTLQAGREAFEERICFHCRSLEELPARLKAYIAGEAGIRGLYEGNTKAGKQALGIFLSDPDLKETLKKWVVERKYPTLVDLWTKGIEIDWQALYPEKPNRISLPTYPFSKEKYWLDFVENGAVAAAKENRDLLHPLVHKNTSSFGEQSYRSQFHLDQLKALGALSESAQDGGPVLASAAYLEMARFAIQQAIGPVPENQGLEISRIEFGLPFFPAGHAPLDVILIRQGEDLAGFQIASMQADGEEIVHCQGEVRMEASPLPGPSAAPRDEDWKDLGELEIAGRMGLPPSLLEGLGPEGQPSTIDSLRLAGPMPSRVQAFRRMATLQGNGESTVRVDAKFLGPDGQVICEVAGMEWGTEPAIQEVTGVDGLEPLTVLPLLESAPGRETREVSLIELEAIPMAAPAVPVSEPRPGMVMLEAPPESLDPSQAVRELMDAVKAQRGNASLRILILRGKADGFFFRTSASHFEAVRQGLYQELASFPAPTVAVMPGDNCGSGFLLAAVCDFLIGSEEGRYGLQAGEGPSFSDKTVMDLLSERFGAVKVIGMFGTENSHTGKQLQSQGWNFPVRPASNVMEFALDFAARLADKQWEALRKLKAHLAKGIGERAKNLAASPLPPQDLVHGPLDIASAKNVKVAAHSDRVVRVKIAPESSGVSCQDLLGETAALLRHIWKAAPGNSIVLESDLSGFFPPPSAEEFSKSLSEWKACLAEAQGPVLAVANTDLGGPSWLLLQMAQGMVYGESCRYSMVGVSGDERLMRQAAEVLSMRLGENLAKRLLFRGEDLTGGELADWNASLHVRSRGDEGRFALELAESWSRHRASILALTRLEDGVPDPAMPESSGSKPMDLPAFEVIKAIVHADGILEVRMEDKVSRNMFSPALIKDLGQAFDFVNRSEDLKVVVLTGYGNYFAMGGTQNTLLQLQEGAGKFTDTDVFRLPFDCAVPVIAAMKGHATGAGWSMAMFSDLAFFAEEGVYTSPYMGYGFTPGAGATFIMPRRLGTDLARHTLFTAEPISGKALQEKGLGRMVLPKKEVLGEALALARAMARNSRSTLEALKAIWKDGEKEALAVTLALEAEMHATTLVGVKETRAKIMQGFAQAGPASSEPVRQVQAAVKSDLSRDSVRKTLKAKLAEELRLKAAEIDDDTPFVDLGLDSITGVTWVRKINEIFGTRIEATKIYGYPTLSKLGDLVMEAAGHAAGQPGPALAPALAPAPVPAPAPMRSAEIPPLSEVAAALRKLLAAELRMSVEEIDEEAQFVDLGLDSITGVTWIRNINQRFGTAIEATKVYSHPTISRLGVFLHAELAKAPAAMPVSSSSQAEAAAPGRLPPLSIKSPLRQKLISWRRRKQSKRKGPDFQGEPIAVVGIAGQFPQADNLKEFWENIAGKKNCITEIPEERWDLAEHFAPGGPKAGKTYSKWAGTMREYDRFDPYFFNISPAEAENMEPQQRLFLQSCWQAVEDAAYSPKDLSGTKCGVFVGCGTSDYHQQSKKHELSAQGFTGSTTSILAARIAYFMNLRGPCLSIETACSSSLVALAQACESLSNRTSDYALAGGVYVMVGPGMHIKTAQAGMLSADGACHTFDRRANGFVPGEGCGVAMLRRLSDAERNGDTIYGIIRGWGVNQDGKTNGITAPNTESQIDLERDVYQRFGIDLGDTQLIETHGTGTKLGDPIEIEALKAVYKGQARNQTAIGSVKSNIGHCLTAAGIASFLKVLLALKHKKLPPTIHFKDLNEHIELDDSPFYVNTELRDWEASSRGIRQAAISSFGFSGTNCHLVVADRPLSGRKRTAASLNDRGRHLIPLSARSAEQLRQRAKDLLAYLETAPAQPDMVELAYTLQTGRDAMEVRLGLIAASVEELAGKLRAYLEGSSTGLEYYQGDEADKAGSRLLIQDRETSESVVSQFLRQNRLAKLLELWVKGIEVDWRKLYPYGYPQKLALPGYPFAKDRYWITSKDEPIESVSAAHETAHIHPLLHTASVTLKEQGFREEGLEAGSMGGSRPKARIRRIALPTYPFAQDRCWIDTIQNLDGVGGSEAAMEELEGDSLDEATVLQLLNRLS